MTSIVEGAHATGARGEGSKAQSNVCSFWICPRPQCPNTMSADTQSLLIPDLSCGFNGLYHWSHPNLYSFSRSQVHSFLSQMFVSVCKQGSHLDLQRCCFLSSSSHLDWDRAGWSFTPPWGLISALPTVCVSVCVRARLSESVLSLCIYDKNRDLRHQFTFQGLDNQLSPLPLAARWARKRPASRTSTEKLYLRLGAPGEPLVGAAGPPPPQAGKHVPRGLPATGRGWRSAAVTSLGWGWSVRRLEGGRTRALGPGVSCRPALHQPFLRAPWAAAGNGGRKGRGGVGRSGTFCRGQRSPLPLGEFALDSVILTPQFPGLLC